MHARSLFQRERQLTERDDAASLPLGKAGHSFARMTSKDIFDQPGGTANKWRKSLNLRKEITNQTHIKGFPSMDKAGPVKSAIKETVTARAVVASLLA